MPEPSPQELLTQFLSQLQVILDRVVEHRDKFIPGRHHELMVQAWSEAQLKFEEVIRSVNEPDQPELLIVGLSGSLLKFELSIFAQTRDELLDHAPDFFGPSPTQPAEPPKPNWLRRLGRRVLRCFKAGDVILGSLAAIFPPAEGIKQFKEAVEAGIELKAGAKK